ncbi:MAG: sigma-54 dependent transcriptional regulator [Deferribacteraceae bacterium]|jgi:DNA-binding NtrC family response regulator|nr:sigma-54 dependent transcriptional regulator [Deferribacteraceae bacterium]
MLNILIIDDDPDILNFYKTHLDGFHADMFSDIESAKSAFKDSTKDGVFPYDIVIIDWLLPGNMTGVQFASWIRAECADGKYPFILMSTVQSSIDHVQEALAEGCDDYIRKPIDEKNFKIRIAVAKQQVTHRIMRRKAELSLKELHKHMRSVLDSFHIGTVLLDRELNVIYYNEIAANIAHGSIVIGRKLSDTLDTSDHYRNLIREWRRNHKAPLAVQIASDYWLELEVYDSYEEPDKYLLYMRDITEVMRIRNAKASSSSMYRGDSLAAVRIRQQIETIAAGDWNVLIEGETGTGKEVAARLLHDCSPRSDKVFLAVNCAGLTETLASSVLFGHKKGSFTGAVNDHKGYFESAAGGTLFLDEIGDISPSLQVMLLRAIELKEITRVGDTLPRAVDVRVLAATNKSLANEIRNGAFRADLYYRLNSAYIKLAPLRERKEDIPMFTRYFLDNHRLQYSSGHCKISNDAMKILMNYSWPGNIRELKSVIQFAAVQATDGLITPNELPQSLFNADEAKISIIQDPDEAQTIANAIKIARGNLSEAARLLDFSRATLYRKLKKYKLQ